MENVKLKRFIGSLIFNIAETVLIFLTGRLIGLPVNFIIILMLTFMLARGCFGKALHFKTWYRCLIWSLTIMLSVFSIFHADICISILLGIYTAFIMTGASNIQDMYLWNNKGEPNKYQDVIDYIKYNEFDDKVIEFETKLKNKGNLDYLVYKYRFKEGRTFNEINDVLGLETPRIAEYQDKIAFAMRLYCGI